MSKTNPRLLGRNRRRVRVRKKLSGTAQRPRLAVFRSAKHIYAQVIDDETGHTLVSASSLGSTSGGGNKAAAAAVGKLLGERATSANINAVVFDRGGFKYHGRVAALADAAREAGLTF